MLGCLGHDMTISLISPQHELMWVTCMHKCNSHVQLIQSNVSPSQLQEGESDGEALLPREREIRKHLFS